MMNGVLLFAFELSWPRFDWLDRALPKANPDAIAVAAFLLIATAAYIIVRLITVLRRNPLQDRLIELSGKTPAERVSSPLMESLAEQLPQTRIDNGMLDRELRRAGYYKPTARTEFLALRNGLVLLALIVGGVWAVAAGPENTSLIWKIVGGALAVAVICWAVPRIILRTQGNRRVQLISDQIPDALDMMAMCLSGGLSLRDTLTRVSRELAQSHPQLALELFIIEQQSHMTSLDHAIAQFADRINSPQTVALSSMLRQAHELGTDMASAIRDYADNLRMEKKLKVEERANKIGIQLMFPLVLLIVPATLLLIWGPSILELAKFFNNPDIPAPSLVRPARDSESPGNAQT